MSNAPPTTNTRKNGMEKSIRADIAEFEQTTGIPFRSAHEWDDSKNFYHFTVMPSDLGQNTAIQQV